MVHQDAQDLNKKYKDSVCEHGASANCTHTHRNSAANIKPFEKIIEDFADKLTLKYISIEEFYQRNKSGSGNFLSGGDLLTSIQR
jgi:hypothetical protein